MHRMLVFSAMWLLFGGAGVDAQPAGPDFYDNIASLPYIYPNVQSYYISSYDRSGGNDDGFDGTYSQLYIDVYGQVNGATTAYRFWPGKIHFTKSITISTEHGNHNDTPANYSSLVYYYYVPK